MQSNVFRDAFVAHARSALTRADALANNGHAGLRGQLREILASELLEKVLPPEVKIGSGQLATIDGRLSKQIDLILYAPSIVVPALFDNSQGYFALESCLYTIEVKSRLSKAGLSQAYRSAAAIKAFPMIPAEHWTTTFSPPLHLMVTGTAYPINALFSFSSDLCANPAAEIARYRAIDPNADNDPAISVIAIRGRGYWYFYHGWKFVPATGELREITALLAGIANTIPQLLTLKGRPRVGNYLSSDLGSHESA